MLHASEVAIIRGLWLVRETYHVVEYFLSQLKLQPGQPLVCEELEAIDDPLELGDLFVPLLMSSCLVASHLLGVERTKLINRTVQRLVVDLDKLLLNLELIGAKRVPGVDVVFHVHVG